MKASRYHFAGHIFIAIAFIASVLGLFLFFVPHAQTAGVFSSWQLTVEIPADDLDFQLPLTSPESIDIDWGDGGLNNYAISGDATHTYVSEGTYTVAITGSFLNTTGSGVNGENSDAGKIVGTSAVEGVSGINSFYATFRDSNITEVPGWMFSLVDTATDFSETFCRTDLTLIPTGLFDSNPNATDFTKTFCSTGIAEIPEGLFDNTPLVTSFQYTFASTSVDSAPEGLFDFTPLVDDFSTTFADSCTAPPAASPTVTTEAVTGITLTSATGNGTVASDGGADITERGVAWSTSVNPTTSGDTATTSGTTGSFTASISGLASETIYYVKAYAINSVGTSYGDEVQFTTEGTVEEEAPDSSRRSSSGGKIRYGCKDTKALNYEEFSSSDPSLCEYASTVPLGTAPASQSKTKTWTAQFTRDLELGMSGEDVKTLQQILIATNTGSAASALAKSGASGTCSSGGEVTKSGAIANCPAGGASGSGGITGYFGPLTLSALIEFQKANGVTPASGHFGEQTKVLLGW